MTLQDFRKLVRKEFGGDLRYMTPANVSDFLIRVQSRVEAGEPSNGRIVLDEPEHTYEGIVRDFLWQALELPPEQAVIRLWLYSLELTQVSINELEESKFERLFARMAAAEES